MTGARAPSIGLPIVARPEQIMASTFDRLDELDAAMRSRTPPNGVSPATGLDSPRGGAPLSSESVLIGTLARLEANQRSLQNELAFVTKGVIALVIVAVVSAVLLTLALAHMRLSVRAEVEQLRFEQQELTHRLESAILSKE